MKVTISETAADALNELRERVQKLNPNATKSTAQIVSKLISEASKLPDNGFLKELSSMLTSEKEQERQRALRLEKLASILGDKALARLEKRAQKRNESGETISTQTAKK